MVQAYWEISKSIVEKQGGAERSEYGKGLIKELSIQMTKDFGKGYTERNLRIIRQFYLYFPIWHAVRAKLSWSQYLQLIKIENEYIQKKPQHMLRLVFIFCNFLSSSIGFNPRRCFLRLTIVFYFRF